MCLHQTPKGVQHGYSNENVKIHTESPPLPFHLVPIPSLDAFSPSPSLPCIPSFPLEGNSPLFQSCKLPQRDGAKSRPKLIFVHFSPASGGNNFNDFPENQLAYPNLMRSHAADDVKWFLKIDNLTFKDAQITQLHNLCKSTR